MFLGNWSSQISAWKPGWKGIFSLIVLLSIWAISILSGSISRLLLFWIISPLLFFSEVRLPKLLRAMKSVKNLANRYDPKTDKGYYEYTDEQRRIIMRDIREGFREMWKAWENAGKKTSINKKKSYWDRDNGNS